MSDNEKCECGRVFPRMPKDFEAHRTTCMYARIADLQLQIEAWRPIIDLCKAMIGKNITRPEVYRECDTHKHNLALLLSALPQTTEKRVGE